MTRKLVAGVDSSTQSVKIVVRDAETGELVREARGTHPDATEISPSKWLSELTNSTKGLLDDVEAISIGAQQHGMVVIDDNKQVVRDALLWNDTRSAQAATDLINYFIFFTMYKKSGTIYFLNYFIIFKSFSINFF